MQRATVLALEDGSTFWGEAFGDAVSVGAEVVFNTAMTGYQEVATDASYRGQIVVFTYPLIGNYGTFARAAESRRPWAEAIVVRELNEPTRGGVASFHEYLRSYGVPGLAGIDTRALVRRLRSKGTMRGYLLQVRPEEAGAVAAAQEAIAKARAVPRLADRPVVAEVSGALRQQDGRSGGPRIALLDTGVKEQQLRLLSAYGATVRLFPAAAKASEILGWRPDGILLSNGPGDPASLDAAVQTTRLLLDASTTRGNGHPLPIFGICLGHQLLARAIGATTSRLPFGHHGANHPVQDVRTGRVAITSQNHEFQVDEKSLAAESGFYVSHRNLNDGSVEGLAHKTLPIRTLQFHPEAAPGPEDNQSAFADFIALCRSGA
ncbi:MAG: glutamine-hydrolyzing carbamoyl-phosphate synthase small subunit [Chloroflexi bacterium]|nr:MAG: glutamine-hydrolyzing carbamoyl-phosphate synthase small subunit [Chloroflexota bacterium]